ncbi:MAG: aspartate/glutamate racemase family protein [Paenalcaligenes sp.]
MVTRGRGKCSPARSTIVFQIHITAIAPRLYKECYENYWVENGAEAVILGCTEISLLIGPQHVDIPLFDTTQLHEEHAADWMLR